VQINAVPLLLINFRKFITDVERFYTIFDNPKKKRGLALVNYQYRSRNEIHAKKVLMCTDEGIELICTHNISMVYKTIFGSVAKFLDTSAKFFPCTNNSLGI